jgi:hypothetical protein
MKIILSVLIFISLNADIKNTIFDLYKNEKYEAACNLGFENFKKYKRDEQFLSLYGFACLKSDYIDRLSRPSVMLKFSKESRSNAAYFSVILMQKKLLYHSLIDGYKLNSLELPSTGHVLSKVFDLYAKVSNKKQDSYLFHDIKDPKLQYKLYVQKDTRLDKIIIEEIYDNKLVKKHIYW